MSAPLPIPLAHAGTEASSRIRVSQAVTLILADTDPQQVDGYAVAWKKTVVALASAVRPDLHNQVANHLAVSAGAENILAGLSIGEVSVVYEALLSTADRMSRKSNGQFFTPDDVARFMAAQSKRFPSGTWVDPCCGVGNLSQHLAAVQDDPSEFVRERLTLVDLDRVALETAVVLATLNFAPLGDEETLPTLAARSRSGEDFLSLGGVKADYAIVNPPYAAAAPRAGFLTAKAGDLYAYFLEQTLKTTSGFISITPASFLGGAKFAGLRALLEKRRGGDVIVFDNIPDTCFRGFKYGSSNSSKTNFVRAAIIASSPLDAEWRITPILRWATQSRARMWSKASSTLTALRFGPSREWARVMPETTDLWDRIKDSPRRLADLVSPVPTPYTLHIASTPRYYISATTRPLDRGSKHVLHFSSQEAMEEAFLALNSSLPYWWWRCLDGGITLPLRVLLSTPLPDCDHPSPEERRTLVEALKISEEANVVRKLNAGRINENVKHPRALTQKVDSILLSGLSYDFSRVYAADMFSS